MTPARPLSDVERIDWVRLARTPNIGPVTFFQLLRKFKSASAALDALPELTRKSRRGKELVPPAAEEIAKELDRKDGFYKRRLQAPNIEMQGWVF